MLLLLLLILPSWESRKQRTETKKTVVSQELLASAHHLRSHLPQGLAQNLAALATTSLAVPKLANPKEQVIPEEKGVQLASPMVPEPQQMHLPSFLEV